MISVKSCRRGDLVLEVQLLLAQPVFQIRDFLERQRVLDRDGDLAGDLDEQVHLLR